MVKIHELWKHYSGEWALRGISLDAAEGRVLGIFGENGGGKSTLLKILAGLLRPSRGVVTIQNMPIGLKTRKIVAFMPEVNHYPKRMTIQELISFHQVFYPHWDFQKTETLLKFMGLEFHEKVENLSKGQKARLSIICTLSWPSELIIMDEPLGAIDPVSRKKILEVLLQDFKSRQKTMILCSHLLTELENFVDDVAYLHQGEILVSGAVNDLREEHGKSLLDIFETIVG